MPPPNPNNPRPTPLPLAQQPANVALAEIARLLVDLGKKSREANEPLKKTVTLLDQLKRTLTDTSAAFSRLAQLARSPFEGLERVVGAINANVTRFVALFQPAAVRQFQLAVDDLYATIGEALLPTLNSFREIVRSVGSGLNSLSGPAKALIAVTAGAAVGMTVLAVAVEAVSLAVNSATAGIPALIGALAGVAAGAFVALRGAKGVRETMDRVVASVTQAVNAVAAALEPMLRKLLPALDVLLVQVARDVGVWADALKELLPLLEGAALATARINPEVFRAIVSSLTGARVLRALGFSDKTAPLTGTEGKSVRNVTNQSVLENIKAAQRSAFGLGAGDDPQKRTAANTEKSVSLLQRIHDRVDRIPAEVREALAKLPRALAELLPTVPRTARPADVADWMARAALQNATGGR